MFSKAGKEIGTSPLSQWHDWRNNLLLPGYFSDHSDVNLIHWNWKMNCFFVSPV